MAAIFPKSSDLILKIAGIVVGLGALSGVAAYSYLSYPTVIDTGYQPKQPIAYSHKLHAGEMGINCYYCHSTVYRGAFAAVPGTEVCMGCHSQVRKDSPRLELLRQSYLSGSPVHWIKVHDLPDYVFFNHRAHVTAGVSCVTCHGRIDTMEEVKQVQPLNMAWCLDCHRNPESRIRPADKVTQLDWVPDRDPAEIGRELIKQKGISPANELLGVSPMSEVKTSQTR